MTYKFAQPADVIITNDGIVYLILAEHDSSQVIGLVKGRVLKVQGHVWPDEHHIVLTNDDQQQIMCP